MKVEFNLAHAPKQPRLFSNFEMDGRVEFGQLQRHIVKMHYVVRTQVDVYHSCLQCVFHNVCDIRTRVSMRLICVANDEIPECQAEYRKDHTDVIFLPVFIQSEKVQ